MEPIDSQPDATRDWGWTIGLPMVALAAFAAVISYTDGLFLIRLAGEHGRVAYLYPLLPDGLIVISWKSLHDAAREGVPRPGWATAGLVLGAGLTLAMNVAAGLAHSSLDALADGFVPVVFFVALEILIGHVRRGRGGDVAQPVPAACDHPEPVPPLSLDEAIRLAFDAGLSKRRIALDFECGRPRVDQTLPPEPKAAELAGASLNGSGS